MILSDMSNGEIIDEFLSGVAGRVPLYATYQKSHSKANFFREIGELFRWQGLLSHFEKTSQLIYQGKYLRHLYFNDDTEMLDGNQQSIAREIPIMLPHIDKEDDRNRFAAIA